SGNSSRHGPHQVAQMLTSTAFAPGAAMAFFTAAAFAGVRAGAFAGAAAAARAPRRRHRPRRTTIAVRRRIFGAGSLTGLPLPAKCRTGAIPGAGPELLLAHN